MKFTKKKVLVAALAVCLIAILSMGSLAWFTASDEVTNNFYVGTTEDDDSGKDVFGIDVWETDPETGEKDQDGLEYTEILPGDVLHKDPTFTNTGVHPQFVRATVTVSDADILIEVMGEGATDPKTLFKDIDEKWELDGVVRAGDDLVYVFYYNEELAAGADTTPIFKAVEIPLEMTLEQAQAMSGDMFTVNILGEAIQSENLGVDNAKDAFAQYMPEDMSVYNGADQVFIVDKTFNGEEIATFDEPTGYYLVNATVNTETGITVVGNATNSMILIDGGSFNVESGKIVSAEASSSPVVVGLCLPITIDGTEVTTVADAAPYFENVTLMSVGNAGDVRDLMIYGEQ